MKQLTKYECEYCHTQYSAKVDASICESGHKTPVGIEDARYVSTHIEESGYPVALHIKMSDGSTVIYKRSWRVN